VEPPVRELEKLFPPRGKSVPKPSATLTGVSHFASTISVRGIIISARKPSVGAKVALLGR
jgi:hypothetical protein